mmetsp:Transcript_5839/g.16476  ORF Transcript_5839/g.16476 Transcript_5839/m.16476 type:complete len:133 (-) Transcript_5839:123-521(-)
MISVGSPEKLSAFLEANPMVPRDRIFVDDSDGYSVFKAMGFGLLGERIPKDAMSLNLKPPGIDMGSWISWITNIMKLSPIKGELGVPEGVRLLGGTLVVVDGRIVFASADRVPGDYPSPSKVLDEVEERLRA